MPYKKNHTAREANLNWLLFFAIISKRKGGCLSVDEQREGQKCTLTNFEVKEILLDLGVKPCLTGLKYLCQIITLFYDEIMSSSVSYDYIYKYLAKMNNTVCKNVEKDIRTCIENIFTYGNEQKINKIFVINMKIDQAMHCFFLLLLIIWLLCTFSY